MKSYLGQNQVKLPFGLKDGELVHISKVPSGLACGCVCSACGVRLVAKKGKVNAHSFAHYKSDECEHAVETALHYAAKQVLEESAQIALPELLIQERVNGRTCGRFISKSGSAKVCAEHAVIIEAVELEKRLDRVIPDVIAYINGSRFLIEIAVTHFVDESKENKLHDLKIPCIEIDLSDVARDANLEDIRKEVVESVANKKWLFHSDTEPVRSELVSKLQSALQTELKQIFEQEQERKRKENELREQKIAAEKAAREKIQPSINLLNNYLLEKDRHLTQYRQQLPNLSIWRRAASSMDISLESLPDFLNKPIKGENIFACDRRAWQSVLFAVFIYNKSQKYDEPYPVSVYRMIEWCKKFVPLNRFALNLWANKEWLRPEISMQLDDFDLYTAVRNFADHLENEGFLRYSYRDFYHIENDTLPSYETDIYQEYSSLTGVSEAQINLLSEDAWEAFKERAGILEFDGGLSRLEAEKQAYKAISTKTQELIIER
jgi:hypothetical protein